MKGQVSTELLVIIGLVLLLFIPLLVLVYFKANESNQQVSAYQAQLATSRLAYLANSVGSLGSNTTVRTEVFIPKDTVSMELKNSGNGAEVILSLEDNYGKNDVVEIIRYPIKNPKQLAASTSSGGWMRVKISADYSGGKGVVDIVREN